MSSFVVQKNKIFTQYINWKRKPLPIMAIHISFFRQAYDCWSQNLFVAKKGADNLGFILSVPALNTASRDCWILSLAVSKLARGQGVAKSLLNNVIEKSKDHYDRLLLTVDPENQAALTLYQSVGFQVIAEELDYFGEGEARLQMAYLL